MPAPLDADLFQRAEKLFHQLLAATPQDRDRYLASLAGEEPTLAEEVGSLLAAHEQPADFFRLRDPATIEGTSPETAADDPWLGRRVGAYRLTGKLGEGGMGVVYSALRADRAYDQAVAIKLLRRALGGEGLESRFRRERQILASLDHVNIARLFDGGSTPEGIPYFAMEAIEGTTLDQHCDAADLGPRQRVELFLHVCSAVAYAHRRLIVHRDIKPGNILVTPEGVAKLLDFGIAKLLQDESESQATMTDPDRRPLTPHYASPEQLRGEVITTASDIYSLGVTLFRLLTGHLPDEEPPSAASPTISGDLDLILRQAMAADPEQRYASVDSLAEDLRRWLDGRPILARPPTLAYRLRKLVGRNRLASGLIAALVLLLVGYAVTATFFSLRLADEHRRVRAEQQRAQRASDFLAQSFDVADPVSGRGAEISVQEILARGAARAEKELQDQPELQARLFFTIADLYSKLGLFEAAKQLFERCTTLRLRLFGADHLETLVAQTELAGIWMELGDFATGERLLEDVERRLRRHGSSTDGERARALRLLGMAKIRQGDLTAAKGFVEESLSLRRTAPVADSLAIGNALHLLAVIATNEAQLERAKDLYGQAVAHRSQELGRSHPSQLASLKGLAAIARDQGDLDASQSLGEEILALETDLWGDEHPRIAFTLNNLGLVALQRGDLQEAERLLLRALEMRRRLLGPDHLANSPSLTNLGALRQRQGRLQEAETHYREALRLARRHLQPGSPTLGRMLEPLGELMLQMDRAPEAEVALRETFELRSGSLGAGNPLTVQSAALLAKSLMAQGRFAEAEPHLLGCYRWHAEQGDIAAAGRAAKDLAELYEGWSRTDLAQEYRQLASAAESAPIGGATVARVQP